MKKWLKNNEIYFKTIASTASTIASILLAGMAFVVSYKQYGISSMQTELMNREFKNNSTFQTNQLRLYEKQNNLIAKQTTTVKQQSNKSLNIARAQLDISKIAALKVELTSIGNYKHKKDELLFINIGETEIKNIELYAVIDPNYKNHGEVTEISYPNHRIPIKDIMEEDDEFEAPLSVIQLDTYPKPKVGQHDFFAVIFKYHRSADMKSYYKILCFLKVYDPTSKRCVYFTESKNSTSIMLTSEDRQKLEHLQSESEKYTNPLTE